MPELAAQAFAVLGDFTLKGDSEHAKYSTEKAGNKAKSKAEQWPLLPLPP